MIKYLKFLGISLCLVVFNYCGDKSGELSGDFYYSSNSQSVRGSNGLTKPIYPIVIEYSYNNEFILIVQKPSKEDHIIFLASDILGNHLVLASDDSIPELKLHSHAFFMEQLNADSNFYQRLRSNLSDQKTKEDILYSNRIADSIIRNDPYYHKIFSNEFNYWIISHKDQLDNGYRVMSKVYGPFTKERYLEMREILGVPKNLKLNFEKD